jgi:hypothetical protein
MESKEKIECILIKAPHKWDIIQTEDGLYGFIESSLNEKNKADDIRNLNYLPVICTKDTKGEIINTGWIYANIQVYHKNKKSWVERFQTKCKFLLEIPDDKEQLEYLKRVIQSTIDTYDSFHRFCLTSHNEVDEDGDPIEGTISKWAEEKLLKNKERRKFYASLWLEEINALENGNKPQAKKKPAGKTHGKKK